MLNNMTFDVSVYCEKIKDALYTKNIVREYI